MVTVAIYILIYLIHMVLMWLLSKAMGKIFNFQCHAMYNSYFSVLSKKKTYTVKNAVLNLHSFGCYNMCHEYQAPFQVLLNTSMVLPKCPMGCNKYTFRCLRITQRGVLYTWHLLHPHWGVWVHSIFNSVYICIASVVFIRIQSIWGWVWNCLNLHVS